VTKKCITDSGNEVDTSNYDNGASSVIKSYNKETEEETLCDTRTKRPGLTKGISNVTGNSEKLAILTGLLKFSSPKRIAQ
jgi:hypothetical protein